MDSKALTARYVHTNLVARDWRALSEFYQQVFGCVPVPPKRELQGQWLEKGSGVPGARLQGMHLRLPGHGPHGPTLEIFQYGESVPGGPPAANRTGLGHLAFEVDHVEQALQAVLAAGGSKLGEIVNAEVSGAGTITWTYARDPEGNIIELQSWA